MKKNNKERLHWALLTVEVYVLIFMSTVFVVNKLPMRSLACGGVNRFQFSFLEGQREKLDRLSFFSLYYTTTTNPQRSERQRLSISARTKTPDGSYEFEIPNNSVRFWLVCYPKRGIARFTPPVLKSLTIGGEDVDIECLKVFDSDEYDITGYEFAPTILTNGWAGWYFILSGVCCLVLMFIARYVKSRKDRGDRLK